MATREFATTVNNPEATAAAVASARETVDEDQRDHAAPPFLTSEDFGPYPAHVPATTFIGKGTTNEPGGIPLRSHDYDFNDTVLPIGVRYYQNLIHKNLPR